MHIRYDDDFVESAVLFCAAGRRRDVPALQIRRFHAAREKLYSILDPDERNAAFFKLHLEWFREWGLAQVLSNLLAEFPLLESLNLLAFRKARDRKEEAAELYVNADTRNAVVALRIERFESNEAVATFLRRELMHLNDMLDPAFGYSPALAARGPSPAQQRIIRERYRLLWDITIDGRLSRTAFPDLAAASPSPPSGVRGPLRDAHQSRFDQAYSFWPEDKRRQVFEELWTNPAPKHDHLLALASDPRDLSHADEPCPGAACPLCAFPTFQWGSVAALKAETLRTLQSQFPTWRPNQGLCSRCQEIYELMGQHEIPATICL